MQGISPRSIALEQREWMTRWEVMTFVEYEGAITKAPKHMRTGNKDLSLVNI